MHPHQIELLLCLILFLPGIYGVFRTRAWKRLRLWLWLFVQPLLVFLGTNLPTPELRFWGGMVISMGILFAVEFFFITKKKEEKKPAYAQFVSLLLCIPLWDHFWDTYGGWLLYHGFSGFFGKILSDLRELFTGIFM